MNAQVNKVPTPTLDAMKAVQPFSQKCGEFLEWLEQQGYHLAKVHTHDDGCYQVRVTTCGMREGELYGVPVVTQQLLAQFFEIDLDAAEREKLAILDALRNAGP